MELSFVTINYQEPTLWLAVGVASVISWFTARFMMAGTRSSRPFARIAAWSGTLLGSLVAFLLPHLLLQPMYTLIHGANTFVCTYCVGWVMLVPFGVWIIALIRAAVTRGSALAG